MNMQRIILLIVSVLFIFPHNLYASSGDNLLKQGSDCAMEAVTFDDNGIVTHNDLNTCLPPENESYSPYKHVPDEILVRFSESASSQAKSRVHALARAKTVKHFKSVKGLQLVKLTKLSVYYSEI